METHKAKSYHDGILHDSSTGTVSFSMQGNLAPTMPPLRSTPHALPDLAIAFIVRSAHAIIVYLWRMEQLHWIS